LLYHEKNIYHRCLFLTTDKYFHIIDYQELYNFIQIVPEVTKIRNSLENPLADPEYLFGEIKRNNISHIIIAGYWPGYVKPFSVKVIQKADKATENIIPVDIFSSIPEEMLYNEWEKAKLTCALHDIPFDASLLVKHNPVNTETLIIEGGISGIRAALEFANSHNKVYLVEKTGTIGGHMAMFDKTFPTLDCAACILTHKMVEVSQH